MAFDDADIDPLRNHPRLHVDCWNHKTRIRRRPKDTANDSPYPFLSGRGVVYHPHPTVSRSPVRPGAVVVGYALLPISELDKVKDGAGKSRLPGSNKSKAKLPSAWEIPAPGFPKGALQKDPARVVATLFEVRGEFSRDYVARGGNKSGLSKALAGAAKR